jgi:ribonucleoside-diphosphate reductase alpha subunit
MQAATHETEPAAERAAPDTHPGPRAGPAPAWYVVDRRGRRVPVRFDLITERNEELRSAPRYGPPLDAIDSAMITAEVVRRFRNGMTTRELDAETAAVCASFASYHGDYEWLAARVLVSDLHKRTPAAPAAMAEAILAAARDRASARLSDEYVAVLRRAGPALAARLDCDRDYRLRAFGYQTVARSYLVRPRPRREESTLLSDELTERPQHLYLRVALGVFVCQPDGRGHEAPEAAFAARLAAALELYDALSLQRASHATPTMLNAATAHPQLSSCFQVATGDDLGALYDSLKTIALTSKLSGGVSLWLHNIRADGDPIRSTGGRSTGIKRYLQVLNATQNYADQGGNRPGAFAVYLGADHADVLTFLRLARLKGEEALEGLNAPDLKYALWVPDPFMEALLAQIENEARVEAGGAGDPAAGDWCLFSPLDAPGLHLAYGDEYRALYARYVAEGRHCRRVKAGDVIQEAYKTWAQRGIPYILSKDHINLKSNLKNVAPICSSNLCAEVLLPSWSDYDAHAFARFNPGNGAGEYGVCNLAALCLESYVVVRDGAAAVDYPGVMAGAALEVRVLDRVIDVNFYTSEECRRSNQRHRPVGLGMMGLADVLARLRLAYGSDEACGVARAIAAAMYYGALSESAKLAEAAGPYASFAGSPMSEGKLQPDLWVEAGHLAPGWEAEVERLTGGAIAAADWAALRARARRGVRNGYLIAYMPTATTSNIVGQNESFEPFTSNLYTRQTLAGEFFVINRHLMAELAGLGLWDEQMRRDLLAAGGSVQGLARVPPDVRRRYRTAREIHPTLLVRMAKAMAPFVCQSMSMNLWLDEPDLPKILRFIVEGWQAGLKSLLYYCHTKPAAGSQKTSVRGAAPAGRDPSRVAEEGPAQPAGAAACLLGGEGRCDVCSV